MLLSCALLLSSSSSCLLFVALSLTLRLRCPPACRYGDARVAVCAPAPPLRAAHVRAVLPLPLAHLPFLPASTPCCASTTHNTGLLFTTQSARPNARTAGRRLPLLLPACCRLCPSPSPRAAHLPAVCLPLPLVPRLGLRVLPTCVPCCFCRWRPCLPCLTQPHAAPLNTQHRTPIHHTTP